jgi:hypothetical protein
MTFAGASELGKWGRTANGWPVKCLAVGVALAATPAPAAERFALDTSGMAGFAVVTAEDGMMTAGDMVVVEYEGPIAYPMAENLHTIWEHVARDGRFRKFVLRLDSAGGNGDHGEEVVAVLARIRAGAELVTLVADNDLCASMCVGIFVQGEKRYASPASSWMFHGASSYLSNTPDPALTARYFDLFRARDIDAGFIDYLYANDYVLQPGAYWISGAELAATSDIITDLLPNWRPADPLPQPPKIVRGGV